MLIPSHTSAQGTFTTPDGEVVQWFLSPRVYQGYADWIGDVSLNFYGAVKFNASRDSMQVTLPPEVAVAIAEGMPMALADLDKMLEEERQ